MGQDFPPYWITVLLAIAAWLFTTTVDQVIKTPYLVYDVKGHSPKQNNLYKTTITLTNITDDKAYSNVSIRFLIENPGEFKSAIVQPYQPAWEGDEQPRPEGHTFQHTLPIIQPGGRFNLILEHTCRWCPIHLTLLAKGTDDKSKDNVIVLTEENYITFIAEYHVAINIILMTILAGIVILYFTHYIHASRSLISPSKQRTQED